MKHKIIRNKFNKKIICKYIFDCCNGFMDDDESMKKKFKGKYEIHSGELSKFLDDEWSFISLIPGVDNYMMNSRKGTMLNISLWNVIKSIGDSSTSSNVIMGLWNANIRYKLHEKKEYFSDFTKKVVMSDLDYTYQPKDKAVDLEYDYDDSAISYEPIPIYIKPQDDFYHDITMEKM